MLVSELEDELLGQSILDSSMIEHGQKFGPIVVNRAENRYQKLIYPEAFHYHQLDSVVLNGLFWPAYS